MATTLAVAEAGENEDYGSIPDDKDLVVSLRQPPSRRSPSSWKTKKVVLGLMMGVMAATLFVAVLRDTASAGPPAARTGPKVELLRFYPHVTITNKTPFDVRPTNPNFNSLNPKQFSYNNFSVDYIICDYDLLLEGLPAGATTSFSRGVCLVRRIRARLWYYTEEGGWRSVDCAPYSSSGTSHLIYSILMKGNDPNRNACCIRSSHELQACD